MEDNHSENVEIIAKALFEADLQELRTAIASRDYDVREYVALVKGVGFESDRAVGILIFSFFEEALRNSLRQIFGKQADALLSPKRSGALSRASDQLRIALGMKWITEPQANDLRLMAKIRNEFAHNVKATSFESTKIRDWVSTMTPWEKIFLKSLRRESTPAELKTLDLAARPSFRQRYLVRSLMSVGTALVDLVAAPSVLQSPLHHRMVLANYDTWPISCRLIFSVTTKAVIMFLRKETHLSRRSVGQRFRRANLDRDADKMKGWTA